MRDSQDRPGDACVLNAPAKINLSLHVVGRRADGYHLLDGLVAFTELGDRIFLIPGDDGGLSITGPFAADVPVDGNLLLHAKTLAEEIAAREDVAVEPFSIVLEKNLPVASGIGGGSADAAALLRWLGGRHPELRAPLRTRASSLGADVPMCLDLRPGRISGVGDVIEPCPRMPEIPIVLVNPGPPVATPAVFGALQRRENPAPPPLPADGFAALDALVSYLGECRNDLEAPARHVAPEIDEVLERLRAARPALMRMSGSGATVFAIFESEGTAMEAARAISAERPQWWVRPTRIPAQERS